MAFKTLKTKTPEEKRGVKELRKNAPIPPAVRDFDLLPDFALVDIRVVAAVEGYSTATAWRKVSSGELPKPIKQGPRITRFLVGDLRAKRAARAA